MNKNNNIPCPVCGKYTFYGRQNYDICKYCGWENDDFFEGGGANDLSLEEYKQRYADYLELNPKYVFSTHGFPEITEKDRLQLDHKYCICNERNLADSTKCGCFSCHKIYKPEEITNWVYDKKGRTAICPYCGIDSVLPGNVVELSEEYLRKMNKIWLS